MNMFGTRDLEKDYVSPKISETSSEIPGRFRGYMFSIGLKE
jgi:hypothetical protein